MKIGDRVRVVGTMLYNGRIGTLVPTSKHPDDPWDFYVDLEPGPPNGRLRTIAVFKEQVEVISND